MKKNYLFGFALAAYASAFGQSMSEDFESHGVGDYMGVVSTEWTTWSGTTGGIEDVQVADNQAASGDNSIYFSSTVAVGGPQDVVVPFGGEHAVGQFTFESNFYVESGKGAYFNIQGSEVIGDLYAMNCQLLSTGALRVDAGAGVLLETTFPFETWFNIKMEIDLSLNDWSLYIDDALIGSFSNSINQVASADLYPVNSVAAGGNDQSGFFMDDVSYELIPYELPEVNGAVLQILNASHIAGSAVNPSVEIRNLGVETITSFDLTVAYNGATITENVSGESIASLDVFTVDFSDALTLVAGTNDIVATISNVNGAGADDDVSDDSKTIVSDPVVPADGKIVVAEEATGTWCSWCPRGAVFLDKMADKYPDHFVGVAVHNGDPMADSLYDAGMLSSVGGYPSLLVDRKPEIDPSDIEADLLAQIVIAPKAVLTIGSDYTPGATAIKVSVSTTFNEAVAGNDYKIAFVATEDGITGTGAGYAQANAYAGGGAGVMGGYELLPILVPAADMVYDHVAHFIMPSFGGLEGVFPDAVAAGETFTANFNVTVDPAWNMDEIHFVAYFIDADGDIDNAGKASVSESADNGFVLGLEDAVDFKSSINLYPNPTSDNANIDLGTIENENVIVKVYDMNGKLISERNYGILNGSYTLPVSSSRFPNGIYNVQILKGGSMEVVKLIVQ